MSPSTEHGRMAAVWALAASFFAWTALPGLHWHDTAEFAAVARRLSLSHSPGHPLHALTTHLVQLSPFGDFAFRANLASGLALATALALLYRLFRRLAPEAPWLAAAAAALLPAVMPAIWLQAVRAEVYGLQMLLTVALLNLLLATADGDRRALAAVALVFGFAGANHSLIGAALVPTALLVMAGCVRSPRTILAAIPAGALGLATYLYLPLRAISGGEVGWGRPDTAAQLWRTISAQEWAHNASAADADVFENLQKIAVFAIEQISLPGALLLSLLGAVGLLPALRARPGLLAAGALAASGFFATRLFYTFDPLNPDLAGYFAGGLIALLATTWFVINQLPRPELAWAFPVVLLLAAPGFDPGQRLNARTAEPYAQAQLDEVPIDGALVLSDYTSTFLSWSLRAGAGARPDVALIFRGQINQPWFHDRLQTQAPRWAARLPGFPQSFAGPEVRFEPGVEGQRLGPLRPRLSPAGLTLAVDGAATSAAVLRAWPTLATPVDLDTRRAVAFHHVQHAMHLLEHHHAARRTTAWHVHAAQKLVGPDPMVLDLAAKLRP